MNFGTNQTIFWTDVKDENGKAPTVNVMQPTVPRKGSPMAAGYDLTAACNTSFGDNDTATVRTGLCVAIPAGWYGKIEGRSGLAFKHGIFPIGGIIDADYRGEIKVCLFRPKGCHSTLEIQKGDRIAQLIIQPHWNGVFSKAPSLSPTQRGDDGFGSTGQGATVLSRGQTVMDGYVVRDEVMRTAQLNRELAGISTFDMYGPNY
jgi:dUTP pyrophosphatase